MQIFYLALVHELLHLYSLRQLKRQYSWHIKIRINAVDTSGRFKILNDDNQV